MRIACLGDSNTRFGKPAGWPEPGPGTVPCWPEFAAEYAPQHVWANVGFGGATACEFPKWEWSLIELEEARGPARVDVLIAAFGTNDFGVLHVTRDDILRAYCTLIDKAGPAVRTIIATTPPRYDFPQYAGLIADLNRRIYALEDAGLWRVVDFDSDPLPNLLLPDFIHVNEAGQRERARRAIAAIEALGA